MNKPTPATGQPYMTRTGRQHISRTGLAIIGATALAAVVLIGGATLTGLKDNSGRAFQKAEQVAETRDLRFLDGNGGSVVVLDAATGSTVATFEPGSNGFLRATMRGLVRQRQIQGIGSQPPFRLVHYKTGHVEVIDPSTGASIALDAFGQTNARVFARLLKGNAS